MTTRADVEPPSNFYCLFDAVTEKGKVPTVFSVRNDEEHRQLKRSVAHAYSMSSLIELESMTDSCTKILDAKLDRMQNRPFDFGVWLQWYAFDVITSITFSNRLGFISTIANRFPAVSRLNSARYIVSFAEKELDPYTSSAESPDDLRDLLARFKQTSEDREPMSEKELLSHAVSNMSV
jgi:cytochrome P450